MHPRSCPIHAWHLIVEDDEFKGARLTPCLNMSLKALSHVLYRVRSVQLADADFSEPLERAYDGDERDSLIIDAQDGRLLAKTDVLHRE